MIGVAATSSKLKTKSWLYLTQDIREDLLLEIQLVFLLFATGIQDAASWADYGCFASSQTGNALFIGIGAANLDGAAYNLSHVGMSLGVSLRVVGQWARLGISSAFESDSG